MSTGEPNTADLKVSTRSETNFQKFGTDAAWFREQLAAHGVKLVAGSQMDRSLNAMTEISASFGVGPKLPAAVTAALTEIVRDQGVADRTLRLMRDGVAATNLAASVRRALDVDPRIFDGKWDLFRGPDVVLARYEGQTFRAKPNVGAVCRGHLLDGREQRDHLRERQSGHSLLDPERRVGNRVQGIRLTQSRCAHERRQEGCTATSRVGHRTRLCGR